MKDHGYAVTCENLLIIVLSTRIITMCRNNLMPCYIYLIQVLVILGNFIYVLVIY